MAYAALLSLSQTLDQILAHEQYPLFFKKNKLVSLNRNVSTLLTFLKEYSHKCPGAVNPLESQIITAAYHAEDIIEYQYSSPCLSKFCIVDVVAFCISVCWPEPRRNFASLQKVLRRIDSILEQVRNIKNGDIQEIVSLPQVSDSSSSATSTSSSSATSTNGDLNTMVFGDDFTVVRERMYQQSSTFTVIPIFGMGGIGKSTLARRLYEDSIKEQNFDRCVWVVVSQDYSLRRILSEILVSIKKPISNEYSDSKLKQIIYQELVGRKYLVVVDDLWSEKAWDDLTMIFPKDTEGSRVLVTTRLLDVAYHVGSSFSPPHEVQLMNEYQSWKLLAERIFKKGSCPCELEQTGKKMAKSCKGLPLSIVIIAGLLKGDITRNYWEYISNNISLTESTIAQHCSKVLSLSYCHLPLYLRPCFLYATVFPEDYEINVKRIVRLWIAEGFVKPNGSKCLEEVAEGYLHDLVGRSLLMVQRTGFNNRIKSIGLHDVLRDFGTSKAQEERFHYHGDLRRKDRRITIADCASLDLLSKFRKPATRSVLIPYTIFIPYPTSKFLPSFQNLSLLRILDALGMNFKCDARKLIHLRYLSVAYADYSLLKSIFKLRNIQTLIISRVSEPYALPLKIWEMPCLRHLIIPSECELTQPFEYCKYEETNLQTIRTVTDLRLTKKIIEILANLKRFRVAYNNVERWGHVKYYLLSNLVHLQRLETLRMSFLGSGFGKISPCFSEFSFPESLKKLSLTFIDGPWKYMSVVGTLPNLEKFRLNYFTSYGGWYPIEGQFVKLKHLQFENARLDHWEAESVHFPKLEALVLKSMRGGLNELPSGIGDIDALKLIQLVSCNNSIVNSAKQIQAEQRDMGNEDLQVQVFGYTEDDEDVKGAKYRLGIRASSFS